MDNKKEQMIRVNQAGEFGARMIYKGQMSALKNNPRAMAALKEMAEQEDAHLKMFNRLVVERKVRPTIMQPLWAIGAYSMGFITALMGEKQAHACTIAVEEVIEEHYQSQLNDLKNDSDTELKDIIQKCKEDETHHKNIATDFGGREAPSYDLLTVVIKAFSRFAIQVSKKI